MNLPPDLRASFALLETLILPRSSSPLSGVHVGFELMRLECGTCKHGCRAEETRSVYFVRCSCHSASMSFSRFYFFHLSSCSACFPVSSLLSFGLSESYYSIRGFRVYRLPIFPQCGLWV